MEVAFTPNDDDLRISVAQVNAFLKTKKNHIISQLMSTGRQMHGHKCMCWLGKKYTCPNYETPWWIRIILWHFGGTMYNFFPTRSPKMRGIVWYNLKKWYKPLATCGCRFWKNFKITGLSRTIVEARAG